MTDCTTCGACCASFRVDFSCYDTQDHGGTVPMGLAVQVNAHTWRMRGTDHSPCRCAALTGTIGERVACAIYEWRPAPCHEFAPDSDACLRARMRHGLS